MVYQGYYDWYRVNAAWRRILPRQTLVSVVAAAAAVMVLAQERNRRLIALCGLYRGGSLVILVAL